MKHILLVTLLALATSSPGHAATAESLLPSGQDSAIVKGEKNIRKGTINAFMQNLISLNKELAQQSRSPEFNQTREQLENSRFTVWEFCNDNGIEVFSSTLRQFDSETDAIAFGNRRLEVSKRNKASKTIGFIVRLEEMRVTYWSK